MLNAVAKVKSDNKKVKIKLSQCLRFQLMVLMSKKSKTKNKKA